MLSKDVIEHAPHYGPIVKELARVTECYLMLSMLIRMHDAPDHIDRQPEGFYHNRYNRQGLYELMRGCGFGEPTIIYAAAQPRHSGFQDEVLVFERRSSPS